jgi:hypothetical protein
MGPGLPPSLKLRRPSELVARRSLGGDGRRDDSHFREGANRHSRGAMRPGFVDFHAPLSDRGAGKAGRRLRPHYRVLKSSKDAHGFDRYSRDIPAFPARVVLRLIRALPGERPFLPPLPAGDFLPA